MKQTRPKQEKRSTACMVPFILNSQKCQLIYSHRKEISAGLGQEVRVGEEGTESIYIYILYVNHMSINVSKKIEKLWLLNIRHLTFSQD